MAKVTKVDASKENADNALQLVDQILRQAVTDPLSSCTTQLQSVRGLLASAVKRLPSQKAIDKDKQRKRKNAKESKKLRKPALLGPTPSFGTGIIRDVQIEGTETMRISGDGPSPHMESVPKPAEELVGA